VRHSALMMRAGRAAARAADLPSTDESFFTATAAAGAAGLFTRGLAAAVAGATGGGCSAVPSLMAPA
jgi:hypothetical protein